MLLAPPVSHPLDEQLASLLKRLDGSTQARDLAAVVRQVSAHTREGVIAVPRVALPEVDWEALQNSPVVGREGDYKPLVVSDTHVWLYRYWHYEQRLAQCIQTRMRDDTLMIISGGPGTGKTTRVTRILADLISSGVIPTRILLAAPTGKAAMRMQESIRHTRQRENIRCAMPEQSSTLHRLLGFIANRVGFRHGLHNPLAADVVIVDEASMIDISLMTHLFEAVPPSAKLILLGDKDQLASVETGSIFRDLCSGRALAAQMTLLQTSYRFNEADGVGQLAQAIREADEARLLAVLTSSEFADVTLDESSAGLDAAWLRDGWQDYIAAVNDGAVEAIFNAFNALRILTPLRQGRQGVETLNAWGDGVMQRVLPAHTGAQRPWYVGRPVMVTQNDYRQNLFNGDIGIALPDANGDLRVWFPTGETGNYRAIAPIRLPAHETAWAMTIHKSQGSEFTRVLLVLLAMDDLPLLGRELLYTAVTRAKQGIHILASRATLGRALRQVTPPASQLQARLSVHSSSAIAPSLD